MVLGGLMGPYTGANNALMIVDQGVLASDGAVGAPGLSFGAELTTGFYRPSAGLMSLAILGANRGRFTNASKFSNGGSDRSSTSRARGPSSFSPTHAATARIDSGSASLG